MIKAGIPVWTAPAAPGSKLGFTLPNGWQNIGPDPAAVSGWTGGRALCMSTGHGLDVIDVDPRHGGSVEYLLRLLVDQGLPELTRIAVSETRSGGWHVFIRSTGAGNLAATEKRQPLGPGIDYRGVGGFVFLPPTRRGGGAYSWVSNGLSLGKPLGGTDETAQGVLIRRLIGIKPERAERAAPDDLIGQALAQTSLTATRADQLIAEKLGAVSAHRPDGHGGAGGFRADLNAAAFFLGGLVAAGHLTEDAARQLLTAAVGRVWPTPDADDHRWIEDGLRDGQARLAIGIEAPVPDQAGAADGLGGADGSSGGGSDSLGGWIGPAPFDPKVGTDRQLAYAVLDRMAPAIRYAPDAGQWLKRGDLDWSVRKDLSGWSVVTCAGMMPTGDPDTPERKTWARLNANGGSSAVASMMRAVVSGADGIEPWAANLRDLDTDPELMWAGGTCWDLRASLDKPVRADRIDPGTPHLRSAAVEPDVAVQTPLWDAFVAAVWPDVEVRAWALRVLSIGLTGHSDRVLPILTGPRGRGKTQLMTLLTGLLGSYGLAADSKLLNGQHESAGADAAVFDLLGRRMAYLDEGPREGRYAVERLKALTGGGGLVGKPLYGQPVQFRPAHTLVMSANDHPVLTDPAVVARVRLIPCEGDPEAIYTARAAIGHVDGPAWQAEAPGVLAAMMAEAARYLAEPRSTDTEAGPEIIRTNLAEVVAEQDLIGTWLAEETEPYEPGTKGSELYSAFRLWASVRGLREFAVPSATKFGRELSDRGFPVNSHSTRLKYRSLRIATYGGSARVERGLGAGSETNPRTPENGGSRDSCDSSSPIEDVGSKKKGGEGGIERVCDIGVEQTRAPAHGTHHPIDLETGPAGRLHEPDPTRSFVRLAGYGSSPVTLTERPADLVDVIEHSDLPVVGHNVIGFDLPALERYGLDTDRLYADGRVRDTLLMAKQLDPPRAGEHKGYSLDAVGERLGLGGKLGDGRPGGDKALKALAKEHGGYDRIPTDDPTYRAYLTRDVELVEQVHQALEDRLTDADRAYLAREHRVMAIMAKISANGFRLDPDLLAARRSETTEQKRKNTAELARIAGMPLHDAKGRALRSPVASKAGREALVAFLEGRGVPPEAIPRTDRTRALATNGEKLAATLGEWAGRDPEVARVVELVGAITASRTIYDTIGDYAIQHGSAEHADNLRVHPRISADQATGRWSVTEPGLTVIGKRGQGWHERQVFVPDPGERLVSVDLSQVDARAVAALSCDPHYRDMFAPGRDLHAEIAERVWGDRSRRDQAKAIGHGWNYGMGIARLGSTTGLGEAAARQFDEAMRLQFPRLVQWREEMADWARSGRLMDNGWGRAMRPDPERAFTQGAAFMGQGCARDILAQGLLNLPAEVHPMLRGVIHDEIVLSVPEAIVHDVGLIVADKMSFDYLGVPIVAGTNNDEQGCVIGGTDWAAAYGKVD